MRNLLFCRRTFIAAIGIAGCLALGFGLKDAKVADAIAAISVGIAAANAYEGGKKTGADKTD